MTTPSSGLEWAAGQAQRRIHDNDVEGLKQLLAEYPALLSWRGDAGPDNPHAISYGTCNREPSGLLARATSAYGDSFDPAREKNFTRRECAELLIDAGAVVEPSVCEGLLRDRARGLLQLFHVKGLLPLALRFLAALGDLESVRACVDAPRVSLPEVSDAFMVACRFEHEAVASLLLDRCIALDAELGTRIDGGPGRTVFVRYLIEDRSLEFIDAAPAGPWEAFLMHQVVRAIHDGDVAAFASVLQRESWMLGESCIGLQTGIVERATMRDRAGFIVTLIELDPALVRRQPPPQSQAIEFALTYGRAHLLPVLTRIWPLPDDLPHAAGTGDAARVKRWFDDAGPQNLSEPQPVLDTALAWAVINRHYEIAGFLLGHGADINTRWSSHEPASLLHELVFRDDYEGMQFLIDRGIDMTITDHRWRATAEGWARYGANNEKMAEWLAAAKRARSSGSADRSGG